jgi:flagellar hook-associated protein 3 FlgL
MSVSSLGDLAQNYVLRQRNTALKQQMTRLTQELASGQIADVRQVMAGNTAYLTDIDRKLNLLEGFSVATAEATHFSSTMQAALERFEEVGSDLGTALLAAGTGALGAATAETALTARSSLEAMVGTLNTDAAGRRLFSGTATDTPPLEGVETLLDGLRNAMTGAGTPADMMAAARDWFDDPAGFEAAVYRGSDTPLASFSLSETESVKIEARATDERLTGAMRLAAVAALSEDPALGLDLAGRTELFRMAGQEMLGARDEVTALRAEVGFAEARIDRVATRNAAEETSLGFARGALLQVDPFDTATKLEEVQFQLESLYTVTARMSKLSLVNFL